MTGRNVAVALTVAGSDPSGGAGLQADLKTFTALGVYGASVVTALTAQNTVGVTGIHKVPADFISAQFDAVVSDLSVKAIKTGMLGDRETVETVSALLARVPNTPVVVDPVMVATSGDTLLAPDAILAVVTSLIPRATLITPNLPEAAKLLQSADAITSDDMIQQAKRLLSLGPKGVLLKGGHGQGDEAIDVLAIDGSVEVLRRPRIATANTHGTGCTLAAAIVAGLAQDLPLRDAVIQAKDFVWRALEAAKDQRLGHGAGPVDHLFARKSLPS